MNVEWEIPFLLTSPRGTLKFNEADSGAGGGILKLDPVKCKLVSASRVTVDQIPQAPGSILHRGYREGCIMTLAGTMMEAVDNAACAPLVREMWDALGLHTNALECENAFDEADVAARRMTWIPTSYGQHRIFGDIRLFTAPDPGLEGWTTFAFSLISPFPYVIDETQTTTPIANGETVHINNPGNCPVWPNVKVYGDTHFFTYSNLTYGLDMVYDDTLPGGLEIAGGDYGFFGHFANNVFLNGSGTNLIAGVDIVSSDFFPLFPGDNAIKISGAHMDLIWNAGWRT